MFDFVGQDDGTSEIFVVQEATSSRSIESSSAGSIIDHGIKPSSTLYVLWFSIQHVQVNVYCISCLKRKKRLCFCFVQAQLMHVCLQEILSGQRNDGTHALNHTSPSQSSLSEPPTQPSLSVSSTHSLLSEPSLQPLPSENSIQPSLTLISQPQEILTFEEPSLPPSPAQEPIIHLDEQETVSQNQSPVSTHHLGGPVDEYVFRINLTLMILVYVNITFSIPYKGLALNQSQCDAYIL